MLSPAAHDCFPFVDDLHFWNLQYLEWMNRGISASIDDYNNCNTSTSNNNTQQGQQLSQAYFFVELANEFHMT